MGLQRRAPPTPTPTTPGTPGNAGTEEGGSGGGGAREFDIRYTVDDFKSTVESFQMWREGMGIDVLYLKRKQLPLFVFPGGVKPRRASRGGKGSGKKEKGAGGGVGGVSPANGGGRVLGKRGAEEGGEQGETKRAFTPAAAAAVSASAAAAAAAVGAAGGVAAAAGLSPVSPALVSVDAAGGPAAGVGGEGAGGGVEGAGGAEAPQAAGAAAAAMNGSLDELEVSFSCYAVTFAGCAVTAIGCAVTVACCGVPRAVKHVALATPPRCHQPCAERATASLCCAPLATPPRYCHLPSSFPLSLFPPARPLPSRTHPPGGAARVSACQHEAGGSASTHSQAELCIRLDWSSGTNLSQQQGRQQGLT
ncbi:unnamed protein product [Closterium sp. NIES-53]